MCNSENYGEAIAVLWNVRDICRNYRVLQQGLLREKVDDCGSDVYKPFQGIRFSCVEGNTRQKGSAKSYELNIL